MHFQLMLISSYKFIGMLPHCKRETICIIFIANIIILQTFPFCLSLNLEKCHLQGALRRSHCDSCSPPLDSLQPSGFMSSWECWVYGCLLMLPLLTFKFLGVSDFLYRPEKVIHIPQKNGWQHWF